MIVNCVIPLPPGKSPTMPELIQLNVPTHIGANYLNFSIVLLDDVNGAIGQALEMEHSKNAERINSAILTRWLQGQGLKPTSWKTLITVIKKIHM